MSEHPFQHTGGERDAEPHVEAVEGGQRQGQRDRRVADQVPAAERPRGAPEQQGAGDHPAEQVDEQDVGQEGADEREHDPPLGRGGEVDVLTLLGLAVAAPQHVDGQGGRAHEQQPGHPDHPEQEGDPQLGAAGQPAPSTLGTDGGGHGGQASPSSPRVSATRLSCSLMKAPNSSPVANASAQLLTFSASFHSWVSCIFWKASISRCRCASEMPGGATTPRQLVKTRSMPASWSVGASMPSMRWSPLVASTRMSPLAIWSLNSPAPEVAKSTLSPSNAGSRSPPPS